METIQKRIHKYAKAFLIVLLLSPLWLYAQGDMYQLKKKVDSNGLTYEYYTNDPLKTVIYTLDNGMKVYFSPSDNDARVQTMIGVRAGSALEPLESTGLAHYLEHMLFKGTSKIGTVNWEKEEPLLAQISELYEEHRKESDPEIKKRIYAQIDSISFVAAKYAAPNELSKLSTDMGATGENASTSMDFTYYRKNIPANELERWADLESERMFNIALRLFHTELETVYEEYNRAQDNDARKIFFAMLENLFEEHPYKRPVIGEPSHLKNPSMVNIHEFFDTYYVPNNMFIILSGDVEPEKAMPVLDKYFGQYDRKELPKVVLPKEAEMDKHKEVDIFSEEEEKVFITYRFDGKNTEDYKYAYLISKILTNTGKVGLLDQLNRNGVCFGAGSSASFFKDYGIHYITGQPKKDQTLEEVRSLLEQQLEKIKAGQFDDWQLEAIVNNMKVARAANLDNNMTRAGTILYADFYEVPFEDYLKLPDDLSKITKEEIVAFANKKYKENYVVINKRKGEKDLLRVEKPDITPLELNKDNLSDYGNNFLSAETEPLKPLFVDYKEELPAYKFANDMSFYIMPKESELFDLRYIIPFGKDNDMFLALACRYLRELGTSKYTAQEVKEELFKYGISMSVSASSDKTYVNVTGLDEHFEKTIELVEHILTETQSDTAVYNRMADKLEKSQSIQKKDKRAITMHARQFMLFGSDNYFTDSPSLKEMRKTNPQKVLGKAHDLLNYKHTVYYSGKRDKKEVMKKVKKLHHLPKNFKTPTPAREFTHLSNDKSMVYILDFDMVQAQLNILCKDVDYSYELAAYKELYDKYYGLGIGSVIFQEIREARALAYSSGSFYVNDVASDDGNYVLSFVGTQAEKLPEAVAALTGLLDTLNFNKAKFEIAREALLKKIESERVPRKYYFGRYMNYVDWGIDFDVREKKYEQLKNMTPEKFKAFFEKHISHENKQYFVLGKKSELDMEALKKLGEVKEVTTKDILGF